ncbi:MAG TPA: arylsulfotransferase family protein [Solirubrobacteraceae bacterium]
MRIPILCAACALGAVPATVVTALASPPCTPATLDNSALLGGAVTVSPLPGSRDATPRTQISLLGVSPRELAGISVTGSRSGRHAGRTLAYSQGDGESFIPSRPFAEGERVTMRAVLRARGAPRAISDVFAIAQQDAISTTPETIHPGTPAEVQGFHSRPDLHPPAVTVTASSPAVAAGDVFVAPYTGPGQAGPMILDPAGGVVWFNPLPTHVSATSFRVQEYAGRPVLTWWQGDISVHGFGLGNDVVLDSDYTKIARVSAGNGLLADLHEFQLTPRGTALITAYDPIYCNISSAGGSGSGAVIDGVLQEIDVRTGLVRMQWTSIDHVPLSDSYEHAANSSAGSPFDFFHINSINLDPDGSLLVSARNTWTIYDIDPHTTRINWRLGGRSSTFTQGAGTSTAWQHDPRELPDGTFSVFDNGSSPNVHGQSRGVVLRIDQQRRTATLVSQFTRTPGLVADSQGNLQALANGDWFAGWGQLPNVSEFSPAGQLLFDAHLPAHTQSYRSFRLPWTGTPPHRPAVAFVPAGPGAGTVYASWNGATQVSSWRVLSGATPASLAAVAQAPRGGFETAVALLAPSAGRYVAVEALDAAGRTLAVSATVPGA